jgi:hypothetical protein
MTRRDSWIRFACLLALPAGAALFAATSAAPTTDEEALRAMHAAVLRAHRESNVAMLLEGAVEDFVQANRGAITRPTLDERRARFTTYLGRTTFEEYRDLADPVVKVSQDGTLAWVIAQVHARGLQRTDAGGTEPIEFTSAWIELYEKRGGRWVSVGNVSNFKP